MDTLIAACGKNTDSSKNTERPRYLAYMLRLWQVAGDEEPAWRASLESPRTGERHGFANLEALFAFLEEHTRGLERQAQPKDVGGG